MNDEIRSNTQEFLSFLGTCMYFYEHNLTPYEQSHVMHDMGMLLRDYIAPKNREKLILVLRVVKFFGANNDKYVDTDSVKDMYPNSLFNTSDVNAVREAYHTGQTHALVPMPGIEKLPELRGEYIKGGGGTNGNDQI